MPYRRLPNTDIARLRALKIAFVKGKELPPIELAFTQPTFVKVLTNLPQFEHALLVHKSAFNSQVNKSNEYLTVLKKAKLYVSHFIQVINMGILRGEMPESILSFYGLEDYKNKVPFLNTEGDVIKWGDAIISGEMNRTNKGMKPVTNPSIALVKVRFELFKDSYNFQKTLQKNNLRTLQDLIKLRNTTNELIAKVWDEVEATYRELPDELRRERSQEYGIIYVFRKNELRGITVFDSVLEESEV